MKRLTSDLGLAIQYLIAAIGLAVTANKSFRAGASDTTIATIVSFTPPVLFTLALILIVACLMSRRFKKEQP